MRRDLARPAHRHASATSSSFSFHPNKNITTIEGGALVLHDPSELERGRAAALAGHPQAARRTAWTSTVPGGKFNLTDVAARIGLGQLRALERFNARRRALARRYFELLRRHAPGCALPAAGDAGHELAHVPAAAADCDALDTTRARFIAGDARARHRRRRALSGDAPVHALPRARLSRRRVPERRAHRRAHASRCRCSRRCSDERRRPRVRARCEDPCGSHDHERSRARSSRSSSRSTTRRRACRRCSRGSTRRSTRSAALRGRSSSTTAAATARRRCCASSSTARPDVTRVVLLNGNFGQHMAILAGFERARGERRRHARRRPAEPAGGDRASCSPRWTRATTTSAAYRSERQDSACRRMAPRAR